MITSQAREILTGVEAVIVDEIHAVAQSKRGSHLALTLERLSHLVDRRRAGVGARSGSGSRRPSGRSSGSREFLVGPRRECEIVDAGRPQGARPRDRRPGRGHDRARGLGIRARVGDGSADRPTLAGADRPGPDRVVARPGHQPALDLARDLPGAARAGPRAHLDDHLRQQPPRRRAARQAAERAPRRASPSEELPATEQAGNERPARRRPRQRRRSDQAAAE